MINNNAIMSHVIMSHVNYLIRNRNNLMTQFFVKANKEVVKYHHLNLPKLLEKIINNKDKSYSQ